jgi:hypothetical protein
MTRDIDEVLRRIAERDKPTEQDRERVWARVQQLVDEARPRRRRRTWTLALAAAVALVLVAVAVQRDVGTEDFSLRSAPDSSPAVQVFEDERGYYVSHFDSLGAGEIESRPLAEETRARIEAGEGKLLLVYGFTIEDQTTLTGSFEVQIRGGSQRIGVDWVNPTDDPLTPEEAARRALFMSTHAADCRRAIQDGRAQYLGSQVVTAWGTDVPCERWAIVFPDYGTIIHWRGQPRPEH